MVIRDFAAAGDGRAHVALDDGSERFSSSVALVDNDILFGFRRTNRHRILERAIWYESLKMRAAGEVKKDERGYYHGPAVTSPSGLSSQDLAALTVWWLIGEASLAAESIIRHRPDEVLAPGMTIGIPMSFYTDADLRRTFVAIARVGWSLFRARGPIKGRRLSIDQAQRYLRDAHADLLSDPISDEEARYWVRSEAEAALWWAFRSPQISDGPYAKIDIGAGTTNASVFRIVMGRPDGVEEGPAVKLKMAFFGASSTPVGMDAVDEALVHWQGSDPSQTMTLRGREDGLLQDEGAQRACRPAFRAMHEALTTAWKQNWALIRHARFEKEAWVRDGRLFLLGGGSLVRASRQFVSAKPMDLGGRLAILNLESPPDLRLNGRAVPKDVLSFVLVAYGLSVLAPPIPMVETPDEAPPMPPTELTLRQLNHEDIYAR